MPKAAPTFIDKTKTLGKRSASGGAGKASNPLFNKDLGQHILKNPLVVTTMIEKANIKSTDTVLEIGPGTGNLTVKLLEKAKKVIAVEFDPRMAAELQKRVQSNPTLRTRLHLIVGDFLKLDPLPYFDVCVSNTPYQISAPLVMKLVETGGWRHALLMFQREFALRLAAKPGDTLWCRLSAYSQLLCRVDHAIKVSRNSFRPPPQVESSVVLLTPTYPRPQIDLASYDGLLRAVFNRPNKTVRANMGGRGVAKVLEANWVAAGGAAVVGAEQGKNEVKQMEVTDARKEPKSTGKNKLPAMDGFLDLLAQKSSDFLSLPDIPALAAPSPVTFTDEDDAMEDAEAELTPIPAEDDADSDISLDDADPAGAASPFRRHVNEILEKSGYAKKRAAKMDVTELLGLLEVMEEGGVRFA
ncbi:rRNA adenine dimethylase [Gonapodya prolifera JEL478]|uniref:rRNA adenine N(6)-methyltransferase n=1 Tax=Gonapodya prolifera (strain JEL478) TaxID=1344416 RepID=A0A139AFP0_GONPJ|nr:rRNA adenine dimethylase [Gonapodya prolifera JEL478]|eukprot:KXS15384.1 rRNA adenine dimethylase [Gonapodya prolifera JEL478]